MSRSFRSALDACRGAAIVAVDMPIGLPDSGPRKVDLEARQVLGVPRSSSVFPVPPRKVVESWDERWRSSPEQSELGYRHYSDMSSRINGKKLSRQAYGMLAKLQEVDALMTPALQKQVMEVHPEVCFWALNNQASIRAPKRTDDGYNLRRRLLLSWLGSDVMRFPVPRLASRDDVIDAYAISWTAARIVTGRSGRLPSSGEELDSKGLRMEMNY